MDSILIQRNFPVDLVQHVGSDKTVCQTARVSTLGHTSIDTEESSGLLNFLMRNRHGSPFEHASVTFRISAPIFVWREFMRHRIGVSYNEQSGRYMELEPVFYIPHQIRPLVQVGKAGEYNFEPGTESQHNQTYYCLRSVYNSAWTNYQLMLASGVAKEVARMCLPVGIYSTAYVTMNPRSLMHFLSLRRKADDSRFPSYPQWEIDQVATKIEHFFENLFPLTFAAYVSNGRVAP